jgi:hypothetical protein
MWFGLLMGRLAQASRGRMSFSVVKFIIKVRCRRFALSNESVNNEPSLSLRANRSGYCTVFCQRICEKSRYWPIVIGCFLSEDLTTSLENIS